mgnify:CR=1 FL=1|jgi:hypothetical protein|tara:strand:+ start:756 stop:941 length:186 start_codon:yes stop_codon:yes gene_type:complete
MLFATDKNLLSIDSYRKVMANLKDKRCEDYLVLLNKSKSTNNNTSAYRISQSDLIDGGKFI